MKDDYSIDKGPDEIEDSRSNSPISDAALDRFGENKYSTFGGSDEVTVDPCCGIRGSEADFEASGHGRSERVTVSSLNEVRVRFPLESDDCRVAKSMDSRGFAVNRNSQVEDQTEEDTSDEQAGLENIIISQKKSRSSEYDEDAVNVKNGELGSRLSRALSNGLEVGEMVWGKVKSHPWWPGHIYNEAFASPSVKRTRREGHVLVAFFGDCSYGWFEPSELILFDPNFAEKSRQTSSRTFLRAVEEAADEAGRRSGLGLTCKCRNPYNFRLTDIQGYFAVDVPDYEPGGIYSWDQIIRARNSFNPSETLAFIKQLALAPRSGDQRNINFIKHKATVLTYRRVVFEQYDETYAQAFGVQPPQPSQTQVKFFAKPVRVPTKAPLSGPLVMAEALGGKKNSAKSLKVKDKKDRYLLKRRVEPSNSKTYEVNLKQVCSPVPSSYMQESNEAGNYVFQKRASSDSVTPPNLMEHGQTDFLSRGGVSSTSDLSGKEVETVDQVLSEVSVVGFPDVTGGTEHSPGEGKRAPKDMVETYGTDKVAGTAGNRKTELSREKTPSHAVNDASPSFKMEGGISMEIKREGNFKILTLQEEPQKPELDFPSRVEGNDVNQVKDGLRYAFPSPIKAKPTKKTVDGGIKNVKALKRHDDDSKTGSSIVQAKKKKKKRDFISETGPVHRQNPFASGKTGVLSVKSRDGTVDISPKEEFRVEQKQTDISASNSLPIDGMMNIVQELPLLLSDLQALALDPFYGIERNTPAMVRQFFLQFRYCVYQKSLVLSPSTDNECVEIHDTGWVLGRNVDEHVKSMPSAKLVKQFVRPDDLTEEVRKRAPSDRQEEIASKRLKKIKEMKTLASEKKAASQKAFETWRGDGREPVLPLPQKSAKLDNVKKVDLPAKAVEPTMLVIKFPPQTSLPSLAELKARFARFGPIDQSGLRVFWKSSTCRVVFLHKLDAQAAHKYAVGNNSLFGNVTVRCYLREVADPAHGASEALKSQGEDNVIETPRVKDPAMVKPSTSALAHQPLALPAIQLKSCLKKSSGEEAGPVTGNIGSSKVTPRVKFMLGGEESNGGEQLVGNRNSFNDASFADGGAPSVAMEFISKNFQKVIPQSSLPILPLPAQFAKSPQNNLHNAEMTPRNPLKFINPASAMPATNTVDISQQMIRLLTRCNDVVNNLSGILGYVPYHPL